MALRQNIQSKMQHQLIVRYLQNKKNAVKKIKVGFFNIIIKGFHVNLIPSKQVILVLLLNMNNSLYYSDIHIHSHFHIIKIFFIVCRASGP